MTPSRFLILNWTVLTKLTLYNSANPNTSLVMFLSGSSHRMIQPSIHGGEISTIYTSNAYVVPKAPQYSDSQMDAWPSDKVQMP